MALKCAPMPQCPGRRGRQATVSLLLCVLCLTCCLQAPKVVMGPGTGLGAAQLMWDGKTEGYHVWPGG